MNISFFKETYGNLVAELSKIVDDDFLPRLEASSRRVDAERLKILVVGEFSRGKSTLINALIGQPVLPSRVNPTTATINIIRGGRRAQATIHYFDGVSKVLDLPPNGVNRFLDAIVTTANEQAHSIQQVEIDYPGRLEKLLVDIVDTPGVNDLDEAREEITFNYMRQADAAVMLLDAQQPLSESERVFLEHKVLGSDIYRIVFVINRIDEVLAFGSVADVERIRGYVNNRLAENLGLSQPEIHAVSAKSTLRARYRGGDDPLQERFAAFEEGLVALANRNAVRSRMCMHAQRLEGLIRSQKDRLQAKARALSGEITDLDRHIVELEHSRQALAHRLEQLTIRLGQSQTELAERIGEYTRSAITAMKARLTQRLESVSGENDLEPFRRDLADALRQLAEEVDGYTARARTKLMGTIEDEFTGLLENQSPVVISHAIQPVAVPEMDTSRLNIEPVATATQEGDDVSAVAAGIGLAYIAGSLFGPIGVAAAIWGAYHLAKTNRESRQQDVARRQREQMIQALNESCNLLADRAEEFGLKLARYQSDRLAASITARAENRQLTLAAAMDAARSGQLASIQQKDVMFKDLTLRLSLLEKIGEECCGLVEMSKNGSNHHENG